ncbi:MAG: phosphoribosylglycinamide formyltransferase [Abyssibacter sp.]|uniref:phosphoribosylglycinamide formyltransferase n=1 Tax=Abyssibacter sp. TaxID=2320200 RepID=UPI00321BB6F5
MTESKPARLVVLISGTGRNLQALIDAQAMGQLGAQIVHVVSNRPKVPGLDRAAAAGIPTSVVDHQDYPSREAFDTALAEVVEACHPDVIALAGFMRILTPGFIRRFAGRLLNIHPSLLPKYRGLHTHRRALEAGDREHGASIHFVTEELDGGPVVLQGRIHIGSTDTPDTLARRVMEEIELQIYPAAVRWMADGRLQLCDGRALMDGDPLDQPLSWPHDALQEGLAP